MFAIGMIFFAACLFSLQAGIAFGLGNGEAGTGLFFLAIVFFAIGGVLLSEKEK